jgi:hypothetical protein
MGGGLIDLHMVPGIADVFLRVDSRVVRCKFSFVKSAEEAPLMRARFYCMAKTTLPGHTFTAQPLASYWFFPRRMTRNQCYETARTVFFSIEAAAGVPLRFVPSKRLVARTNAFMKEN